MNDLDILINAPDDATPEELAAYLDQACSNDQALRQRVEDLFTSHGRPEHFMEHTTFPEAERDLIDTESEGSIIGDYKLLQKIGEGGFGVVYMADQFAPVKRRVALKIIKLGMDTKQVVARFEVERQALAMMEHPSIAKVYDAGSTELGRPYFVMELVRGVPITEFCDDQMLDTAARLSLFMEVCAAIQHAHQKGIIHRDLKPSNVIVTLHDDKAVPKVIDFGVAKATQQDLTDKTLFTQFEQFIGTPAYMSPEQAQMSGLDIDTRSDIYTLGVLLYELLTGTTPFEAKALANAGQDEIRRVIREEEPPRPSTRLTVVQKRTLIQSKTESSGKTIDRDLDWIVMKALEKDRTRRYDTATGLAKDIGRHLAHEPVEAGPPGFSYRFGKILRRHMAAVITSAAMIVLLAGSAVVSTTLFLQAKKDQKEAVDARTLARESESLAMAQKETATIHAYASDISLLQSKLERHNLGEARKILNRQRPEEGEKDLRGWEWRYLWQQCQGDEIETLLQSEKGVSTVALSSNNKWMATAEKEGGKVQVWDLRTKHKEPLNLDQKGETPKLAFSPGRSLLAFTDQEDGGRHRIRIWNLESEELELDLPLESSCWDLAFSKDGHSLVTGEQQKLTRWDLADKTVSPPPSRSFPLFPRQENKWLYNWLGTRLAVSRDLSKAYVGDQFGKKILEVDLNSGEVEPWPIEVCEEKLFSIALSPDQTKLATGPGISESTIKVWDTSSKEMIGILEGHRSWITTLVFSPDGKRLFSASADQTIRMWDVDTWKLMRIFQGHLSEVWDLALSTNGEELISGSKDKTVKRWEVSEDNDTRGVIKVRTGVSNRPGGWERLLWAFAPDSESLFLLDKKGKQVLRYSGPRFKKQRVILSNVDLSRGVALSKFDELMAVNSGGGQGEITVWELGEEPRVASRLAIPVADPTSNVVPIRFTEEDSLWILIEERNELQEWDPRKEVMIRKIPVPRLSEFPRMKRSRLNWHLRSLSEKNYFGINKDNGEGIVVDLASGRIVPLKGRWDRSIGTAISPDENWLAVCREPGEIDLRDARTANAWTGEPVTTLGGILTSFKSVGFSSDSKRLIASSDGEDAVKLWEMSQFRELVTLPGEGSVFSGVAFSRDENSLGAINGEGVIHIWQAPSWEEIADRENRE